MIEPLRLSQNVGKLSPYHMVSFPGKNNLQSLPNSIGASFQTLIFGWYNKDVP